MNYFITQNTEGVVEVTTPVPPKHKYFKGVSLIVESLPVKKDGEKYQIKKKHLIVVPKTDQDLQVDISFQNDLSLKVIDKDTSSEISKGFDFDGKKFSLSINAQLNWQRILGLHLLGDFVDTDISTLDSKSYTLKTTDVVSFTKAGSGKILNELQIGRDKKKNL